jgi:SAM-dependent methyltransferase
MYRELKRILKALIPRRSLFKYEPIFRLMLYQFYRGSDFQCNICNKKLRKFILLESGDKLCPFCGSLSRTRRLWNLINVDYLREGLRILDFSPSRSLYRVFKKTRGIDYVSTDISGDFLSDFQFDITDIDTKDDQYDLLLCYHVLEHIDNDHQAIKEIFRVLKKGGTCMIQTPFKEGDIYEDPSIISEQDRLKHFGQKDHVRVYSVEGLKHRLVRCGFHVDIKQFSESERNRFGFNVQEFVLICTK